MRALRSVLLLFRFPPDFAGGGLQASRLMERLGAQGVEMRALTMAPDSVPAATRERAFGGEVRRFRVFGGPWTQDILLSLKAGLWLLLRSDWDLLHCSGFSYFGVLPVLVAKWKGRPVLIKTTVLGRNGAFNPGRSWLARKLLGVYARADVIVALSQALEDDLRGQERVQSRVLQIPNGVDTELFRPARGDERARARAAFDLDPAATVIVSCGMLYPRKNVAALVRSLSVTTTRPLCLVVAGPPGPDAAYLAEIDEAIAAVPEGVEVRLVGGLEPERLAELHRAGDLFVLLSRAEGLPNALLEGMASGLACVASDIPGAADVLDERGGGVLVPLDDAAELAATLDRLADDPAERVRLGSRARQRIEDEFALDRIAERYRALYDEMLASGSTS